MTGHQKGLLAEYFTVGWNVIEGVIAIAAGVVAGSIALVGFGFDRHGKSWPPARVCLLWRATFA